MKRIFPFLRRFCKTLTETRTNFPLWLGAFSSLIVVRLLVETWLFGFENRTVRFLYFEWTHTFSFFLLAFVLFLPIIRRCARVDTQTASNVLLFGFLVIIFPPIIDFILSQGVGFWSFYLFDGPDDLFRKFFLFFGDRPDMGITYGVRVEVALVSLGFIGYVFLLTGRVIRAIFSGIIAYSILFFLGTFPSWATAVVHVFSGNSILFLASDVAAVFLSPLEGMTTDLRSTLNIKMSLLYVSILPIVIGIFLFFSERNLFFSLLRNARFPQVAYHIGLFAVGAGLAFQFGGAKEFSLSGFEVLFIWCLLLSIVSAWLASVVANDFFDIRTDKKTNTSRPIPSGEIPPFLYGWVGISFFVVSLVAASLVSFRSAGLILAYQAIAWGYSSPPFRLKRFPIIASFVSAVASILILLMGFSTFSFDGTVHSLPFQIVGFFLLVYTLVIPLKDFKDIEGDTLDGTWTIPVIFGVSRAKTFIGSGIFFSFLASVFLLRDARLFLPALLAGTIGFWIVSLLHAQSGWFSFRTAPGWIFGLAFFYGVVLVVISL